MLSSPRNRGTRGVDDPWDDDGFYVHRKFKARGKSGQSGKKLWRRALRTIERRDWQREDWGDMSTDLEQARKEEIEHVLGLAKESGLELSADDITFADGGHYPYIDGMDAEDWIQAMTMD
jgi:hypothetical protein